jgi:predicted RNase H-like HicB family nuclease
MTKRTLQIDIHRDVDREPPGYWAQVPELEGCFATGQTLDELLQALHEAITMCLADDENERILTRLIALRLEIEPDLRPADTDPITEPPARRKRQSHRDDWPPPTSR